MNTLERVILTASTLLVVGAAGCAGQQIVNNKPEESVNNKSEKSVEIAPTLDHPFYKGKCLPIARLTYSASGIQIKDHIMSKDKPGEGRRRTHHKALITLSGIVDDMGDIAFIEPDLVDAARMYNSMWDSVICYDKKPDFEALERKIDSIFSKIMEHYQKHLAEKVDRHFSSESSKIQRCYDNEIQNGDQIALNTIIRDGVNITGCLSKIETYSETAGGITFGKTQRSIKKALKGVIKKSKRSLDRYSKHYLKVVDKYIDAFRESNIEEVQSQLDTLKSKALADLDRINNSLVGITETPLDRIKLYLVKTSLYQRYMTDLFEDESITKEFCSGMPYKFRVLLQNLTNLSKETYDKVQDEYNTAKQRIDLIYKRFSKSGQMKMVK